MGIFNFFFAEDKSEVEIPVISTQEVNNNPESCDTVPCSNGGTCARTSGGKYFCQCAAGWRDAFCNTRIAPPTQASTKNNNAGKLIAKLF